MSKMVTRTIIETKVTVDVVDLSKMKIKELTLSIAGKIQEGKLEKEAEKLIPDGLKLISVKEYSYSEKLYGLEEQKFLELAQELPPRKIGVKGGEK